ncbi:uncharacterized protein LOC123666033 [Melitaea cinxia]|uniref:uncharacterized protein LOC123666033 n=1 Tax=Melitaea cinxia TaxID=113334 RepID=UPI001E273AFA|nr:uncharacterized protein LOC123666033 [Melitaea cinxia]
MTRCKNIKCPPVEDPVCVKIKKNNEKHKGTYILAINKCEIQYATCHQDLKRVKRDNDGEADMTDEKVVSNNEDVEEGNTSNASNESNGNDNEEDKKESPNVDDEKGDEDEDPNKNKQQTSDEKRLYEYIPDLNLGPDYDIKEKDVDYDQYGNDCPSVCPVREMMVCAECGHKIYKTFLSPCHLRQFNCKYPDEKLKLVKREPCMQSAPFLANLNEAKGRVSEPTDEDRVLKFINCRDTGKLGDQDCKFDDKL